MTKQPTDSAGQLQWLQGRAAVSDLILSFARAIDENDADAYADCFAKNGSIDLPHVKLEGQDAIRAMTHNRGNGAGSPHLGKPTDRFPGRQDQFAHA